MEIGTINTTGYNHTHSTTSSHNLIPFIISNGKINANGITATSTMQFLIRGNNIGVTNAWYVTNNSRTGATQTTTNQGNTWTTQTYSLNTHLHTFTGTSTLNYKATGQTSTLRWNSTLTSEAIDLNSLPPTAPVITNPLDTTQATQYLNITWLPSLPFTPSIKIQNYTIKLLNQDLSLNQTLFITNNATTSYYWDIYSTNIGLGKYYIEVSVNDSLGQTNNPRTSPQPPYSTKMFKSATTTPTPASPTTP